MPASTVISDMLMRAGAMGDEAEERRLRKLGLLLGLVQNVQGIEATNEERAARALDEKRKARAAEIMAVFAQTPPEQRTKFTYDPKELGAYGADIASLIVGEPARQSSLKQQQAGTTSTIVGTQATRLGIQGAQTDLALNELFGGVKHPFATQAASAYTRAGGGAKGRKAAAEVLKPLLIDQPTGGMLLEEASPLMNLLVQEKVVTGPEARRRLSAMPTSDRTGTGATAVGDLSRRMMGLGVQRMEAAKNTLSRMKGGGRVASDVQELVAQTRDLVTSMPEQARNSKPGSPFTGKAGEAYNKLRKPDPMSRQGFLAYASSEIGRGFGLLPPVDPSNPQRPFVTDEPDETGYVDVNKAAPYFRWLVGNAAYGYMKSGRNQDPEEAVFDAMNAAARMSISNEEASKLKDQELPPEFYRIVVKPRQRLALGDYATRYADTTAMSDPEFQDLVEEVRQAWTMYQRNPQ